MPRHLVRMPGVTRMTGLSRLQIYALMKAGLFPRPVRIGVRAVAWLVDEHEDYTKSRPRGGSERPKR